MIQVAPDKQRKAHTSAGIYCPCQPDIDFSGPESILYHKQLDFNGCEGWYHTEYHIDSYCGPDGLFGTVIWAVSRDDAKRLAELRGLGEIVTDALPSPKRWEPRASSLLRTKNCSNIDRIHGVTWLCNLAAACGLLNRDETIGDKGLLHQFIHYAGSRMNSKRIRQFAHKYVIPIERRIPGYLSRQELEE